MKETKMMDEVLSYCTKCKLELNHRVTLAVEGKPKKVLCLTCKGEHAYRKSPAAKATEAKTRKPRVSAAKTEEAEWRAKLEKGSKTIKPYGMDKSFDLEDHVQHQLFGIGLVVTLLPPGKVNIFFQDGLKTMKCA
jgi:hypothetical protein